MARLQDMVVEIKCDTQKIDREMVRLLHQIRDSHCYDAYVYGNEFGKLKHLPNFEREKGTPKVKKLYKVFVIQNQEKVHEVNQVANSHEGAKFDAVKELGLDASYDELDVYALEIFTLKKRNCC